MQPRCSFVGDKAERRIGRLGQSKKALGRNQKWRSQGVDPEGLFAISVKAATEHRQAYGPIAKASYTVEVPGPCTEDLRRLPFGRVSRPICPLDDL